MFHLLWGHFCLRMDKFRNMVLRVVQHASYARYLCFKYANVSGLSREREVIMGALWIGKSIATVPGKINQGELKH